MIRLAWAVVVLALCADGPAGASALLEFLSIEANEGASSGGHAAIRLGGDTVYHFVHERPGLLRLERTPWPRFELAYRMLENRGLTIRRIPVSEETGALIEQEFARRYLADAQAFAIQRALAADRDFLAEAGAADPNGEPPTVDLPVLGLFAATWSSPDPALAALRSAIGPAAIDEPIVRTMAARRAVLEATLAADPTEPGGQEISAPYYGVRQRLVDLYAAFAAVDILQSARGLSPTAVRSGKRGEFSLTVHERELVVGLQGALARTVRRLLGSSRPDVGTPLALALARWVALERSAAAGQWILLDAYGPEAVTIDPERVAHHRSAVVSLLAVAESEFATARSGLTSAAEVSGDDFPEAAFVAFETAGNRLLELAEAVEDGRPLRVQAGTLVPSRGRVVSLDQLPWSGVLLRELGATVQERERAHGRALGRARRYGLVSRNCVTELQAVIDVALSRVAAPGRVGEEWQRRLGGELGGPWPLDVIPATSAVLIDRAFPGVSTEELPSLRHAALAQLRADDPSLLTALREEITLTSRLYRPGPDDSVFLFFTEETVLARPLLGAVNLGAGLLATVGGAVVAPFDGGHAALAGLRGALFSLPELVLINIRKGSYDALPCGVTEASGLPVSGVPGGPPG